MKNVGISRRSRRREASGRGRRRRDRGGPGREEATVKSFYREADHVRLQPENETMAPILSKDVRVLGKVVGLMRSMG